MSQDQATRFVTDLLSIWNEADRKKRRTAIESHYQPDIHFTIRDGEFRGYESLEDFADERRARRPGERFELVGRPEVLGNAIRAHWRYGDERGMDIVILADGRVCSLYLFRSDPTLG
jgi:hypothetical protein